MKQWEIYNFPFPSQAEPHPFVIAKKVNLCFRLTGL